VKEIYLSSDATIWRMEGGSIIVDAKGPVKIFRKSKKGKALCFYSFLWRVTKRLASSLLVS